MGTKPDRSNRRQGRYIPVSWEYTEDINTMERGMVKRIAGAEKLLIEKLLQNDFKVMIYDSRTTNSIYIKVDFGILDTIRISDHDVPKHKRACEYNIVPDICSYPQVRMQDGKKVLYATDDDIGVTMITTMLLSKRRKIRRMYGKTKYLEHIYERRQSMQGHDGFWEHAMEITDIKDLEVFRNENRYKRNQQHD